MPSVPVVLPEPEWVPAMQKAEKLVVAGIGIASGFVPVPPVGGWSD
jgi:hypothetical protein